MAHNTNLSENILGKAKDIWNIATDTVKYTPEAIGELVADANIAYRHWKDMNRTGKKLVNKYGSNAAANWGLNNPDKDCKIWLNDLDFRKNEWKK